MISEHRNENTLPSTEVELKQSERDRMESQRKLKRQRWLHPVVIVGSGFGGSEVIS